MLDGSRSSPSNGSNSTSSNSSWTSSPANLTLDRLRSMNRQNAGVSRHSEYQRQFHEHQRTINQQSTAQSSSQSPTPFSGVGMRSIRSYFPALTNDTILSRHQALAPERAPETRNASFFLRSSARIQPGDSSDDDSDDADSDPEQAVYGDHREDLELRLPGPNVFPRFRERSPHVSMEIDLLSPPPLVSVSPPQHDGRESPRRLSRSLRRNRQFSFKIQSDNPWSQSRMTLETRNYKKFSGHRNQKTVIKEANFWGDNFIVSGSDCGHIFFWSIEDQKLVALLKADRSIVNCVQPHPTAPSKYSYLEVFLISNLLSFYPL